MLGQVLDERHEAECRGRSAVMTVTTREVGKAWATRSLGIALAICMSLTVGGDLTVRASAEPWSGILDPSRAIDWSHAGIPVVFRTGQQFVHPSTRAAAPPRSTPRSRRVPRIR